MEFFRKFLNLKNGFPAVLCALVFFFFVFISIGSVNDSHQQFSYLAQSFLEGKLYFNKAFGTSYDFATFNGRAFPYDSAIFGGHAFWPLGPFPTVLLLPFVFIFNFFGLFFFQGYLQFFLVAWIFYLLFCFAKKFSISNEDALYLAFAFTFVSSFLGVAALPTSWYFAQVVTVLFLLLALNEYFWKRRFWLIGIFMGCVALTRITAGVGIIFFAAMAFFFPESFDKKTSRMKEIAQLFFPFLIALLLLGLYNYLRFGNVLEQGYAFQSLLPVFSTARSYGLMSLAHVPGNLFYAFLSTPLPVFRDAISHVLKFPFLTANLWGMSIFVTSPYLLSLFFFSHKEKLSKILLGTIALIAIPIFLYYGIGYVQFGYRYALDFMPFLFLLFLRGYFEKRERMSWSLKIIIIISSFANLFLFLTFLATIAKPL